MPMMNCVSVMSKISFCHMAKITSSAVYEALSKAELGTSNIGLVSDIGCLPGTDYCSLATARSIPGATNCRSLRQVKAE